jgi:hypothetical protein
MPGLVVRVVQQGTRLEITNKTRRTIVVLGYANEPYLRFLADGEVDVNVHSPASPLDLPRYGVVKPQPETNPDAKPRWQPIADDHRYDWHDHRIHLRGTVDPAAVAKAPGSQHHLFNWAVPLLIDGKRFVVHGSLDYIPGRQARLFWVLALSAAGVVGLALVVRSALKSGPIKTQRRSRRRASR